MAIMGIILHNSTFPIFFFLLILTTICLLSHQSTAIFYFYNSSTPLSLQLSLSSATERINQIIVSQIFPLFPALSRPDFLSQTNRYLEVGDLSISRIHWSFSASVFRSVLFNNQTASLLVYLHLTSQLSLHEPYSIGSAGTVRYGQCSWLRNRD